MDINHVVLIGRLTRDAEYKVLPSGLAVCNFSIAINRRKKNGDTWEEEASYFDIALWGKQADAINRYLVKGKQVAIDGELRQDRWQQDGQNRSKVVITANNVQLLGSATPGQGPGAYSGGSPAGGESSGGGGYSGGASGGGSYGGGAGGRKEPVPSDDFADDVPF